MSLYRLLTLLVSFYITFVQAVCGTWILCDNQVRDRYYRGSLNPKRGVTHDFGSRVRICIEQIDLKMLYERHKAELAAIRNAMDSHHFLGFSRITFISEEYFAWNFITAFRKTVDKHRRLFWIFGYWIWKCFFAENRIRHKRLYG